LNKHKINITRGRLPEKADAQRAGHLIKKNKKKTYKPTHTVTFIDQQQYNLKLVFYVVEQMAFQVILK